MVIKILHLFLFMFLMWLLENFKLQMGLIICHWAVWIESFETLGINKI